uniref:Secreted protein n=1 Tax=Panagrellus redivivus TaxID=6233 RepID=A0A7E4W2Y3_PANRE
MKSMKFCLLSFLFLPFFFVKVETAPTSIETSSDGASATTAVDTNVHISSTSETTIELRPEQPGAIRQFLQSLIIWITNAARSIAGVANAIEIQNDANKSHSNVENAVGKVAQVVLAVM